MFWPTFLGAATSLNKGTTRPRRLAVRVRSAPAGWRHRVRRCPPAQGCDRVRRRTPVQSEGPYWAAHGRTAWKPYKPVGMRVQILWKRKSPYFSWWCPPAPCMPMPSPMHELSAIDQRSRQCSAWGRLAPRSLRAAVPRMARRPGYRIYSLLRDIAVGAGPRKVCSDAQGQRETCQEPAVCGGSCKKRGIRCIKMRKLERAVIWQCWLHYSIQAFAMQAIRPSWLACVLCSCAGTTALHASPCGCTAAMPR